MKFGIQEAYKSSELGLECSVLQEQQPFKTQEERRKKGKTLSAERDLPFFFSLSDKVNILGTDEYHGYYCLWEKEPSVWSGQGSPYNHSVVERNF